MDTGRYNLSIQWGESYNKQFKIISATGLPLNLTAYTASSYIKPEYASVSASVKFIATIPSPTEGVVNLYLPPVSSSLLTGSCYFYDVRLSNNDIVIYPLEGKVTVSPSITK